MLTLQEIKLLGEFVDSAIAAGFIKSVQGCAGAAQIAQILQREAANEAAVEKSRQDAARAELKRLANLGVESEKISAALKASGAHTDSGLGNSGFDGLCAPSVFENGEPDFPRTA